MSQSQIADILDEDFLDELGKMPLEIHSFEELQDNFKNDLADPARKDYIKEFIAYISPKAGQKLTEPEFKKLYVDFDTTFRRELSKISKPHARMLCMPGPFDPDNRYARCLTKSTK